MLEVVAVMLLEMAAAGGFFLLPGDSGKKWCSMVGGYREQYFLVLNQFMALEKAGSPWKHAYLNLLFIDV